MRLPRIASALALAIAASACVPSAEPPPVNPSPAPTPVPVATPTPTLTGDWRDWPLTNGDWHYRLDASGSTASYGQAGAAPDFTMRCDKRANRVYLTLQGAAPGALPLTIRTSSQTRTLSAQPSGGTPQSMTAALAPNDRLLDAMGFSRGRFIVQMPPMATLVIPSWAEVLRVTEDCR